MTLANNLKRHYKLAYSMEDRQAFPFCYLMLLIPVAQFIVFWVVVNINSVIYAFTDSFGAFTLENFQNVFIAFVKEDAHGWALGEILGKTVLYWFIVNIVCTPLITLSTYILYKRIPGHNFFRIVFAIPAILGSVVWTRLVSILVGGGEMGGPIISILMHMGFDIPKDIMRSGFFSNDSTAYITIILVNSIPHLIACDIALTGAYTRIPKDLVEASHLDGVGFFGEFLHVAIPTAWPTLVITLVSGLSTIFTADGCVFLYTMGEHKTATMGFYLYYWAYNISSSPNMSNQYGFPAALGFLLTLMTLPTILLAKRFLERAVTEK